MSVSGEAIAANSAGHAAMKRGDKPAAEALFAKARKLAPDTDEFALNHAIALNALDRPREALAALTDRPGLDANPACWTTRGTAQRALGNRHDAASNFDRALALQANRPTALAGRAQVALERGEPDALARFERALAVRGTDPELWLGKAEALAAAGRHAEAVALAEAIAAQGPEWLPGLRLLAQLRLHQRADGIDAVFQQATAQSPKATQVWLEWARQLAGLDRYDDARRVVERALDQASADTGLMLALARYAGAAGDTQEAERLLAALPEDAGGALPERIRHDLRTGKLDAGQQKLDHALAEAPSDIGLWALQGLLWQASGDARAAWLHGQDGLVALLPLHDADTVLPPAIARLHDLHNGASLPLDQSLRGGTQTRGNLFDRTEPEFAALRDAIAATLKAYRGGLPSRDNQHPLLRHRDATWNISGSWSVRLAGGGDHHASHIHPQGVISSALYCELPPPEWAEPGDDPQAGWIELGRPPVDLPLEVGPLATLEPKAGWLALFPSTLYHGTRPFPRGTRMTVAFDVTLRDGPIP